MSYSVGGGLSEGKLCAEFGARVSDLVREVRGSDRNGSWMRRCCFGGFIVLVISIGFSV